MSSGFSERKSGASEIGNEKTLEISEPLSCVCICDFLTLGGSLKGAAVNFEMEKVISCKVRSSTGSKDLGRPNLLSARSSG